MIDHQLLAYLEGFVSEERKKRFLEVLEQRTNFITVGIEDVFQMHNTSAVIRSCEVFGVQRAHVIENKFKKRLDKNIAMGAQKWVDIEQHQTASSCISTLRAEGYKIVATTPHTEHCLLDDFKLTDKTALFFGTEQEGLSKEVLEQADEQIKIPMVGFTESLNISVSAAIILNTLTVQLRKSNLDWRLTEEEMLEKRMDWAQKSIKSIDAIMARYYDGE
ncbi:TrmH family RNA methyltransferase [Spongiimicrobium sp. 3-5]|uniref:TrmH family RNA methyltransferase n=1 Tax=Spongiimicrobium sp. 3-5 TaxID=3332596 RepID=UPI00397F971C